MRLISANSMLEQKPAFGPLGPERRLAAAILLSAWEDTFATTKDPLKVEENHHRRIEAMKWILYDSDFAYWCEVLAVDVRAVRDRYVNELARQGLCFSRRWDPICADIHSPPR